MSVKLPKKGYTPEMYMAVTFLDKEYRKQCEAASHFWKAQLFRKQLQHAKVPDSAKGVLKEPWKAKMCTYCMNEDPRGAAEESQAKIMDGVWLSGNGATAWGPHHVPKNKTKKTAGGATKAFRGNTCRKGSFRW